VGRERSEYLLLALREAGVLLLLLLLALPCGVLGMLALADWLCVSFPAADNARPAELGAAGDATLLLLPLE
jgi:hypothetical protein